MLSINPTTPEIPALAGEIGHYDQETDAHPLDQFLHGQFILGVLDPEFTHSQISTVLKLHWRKDEQKGV